jgi:hypothetical protein
MSYYNQQPGGYQQPYQGRKSLSAIRHLQRIRN